MARRRGEGRRQLAVRTRHGGAGSADGAGARGGGGSRATLLRAKATTLGPGLKSRHQKNMEKHAGSLLRRVRFVVSFSAVTSSELARPACSRL